jgi:hypothetical protein
VFSAAFGLARKRRPVVKAVRKKPVRKARKEKKRGKPKAARKGNRSRRPGRKEKELAEIDFYSYQKVFKQKSEDP